MSRLRRFLPLFLCLAGTAAAQTPDRPETPADPAASPPAKEGTTPAAALRPPPESAAVPAAIDPRTAFAGVDQATLQTLYQTLQQSYLRPDSLTWDELNRAALAGIVQHLQAGAGIVPVDQPAAPPPLAYELLTPRIAWLRPGSYSEAEIPDLDRALAELAKTKVELMILDLRCPSPHRDLKAAAALLSRFLRDEQPLFTLRRRDAEPEHFTAASPVKWMRRVVLLVDEESGSSAEVIAAVLKSALKPLVTGAATRGAAAQFRTIPLTDKFLLQFADGDIVPEGGEPLFGQPIRPDFPLKSDPETKRLVIAESARDGMAKHVFESERPRLNEAALVAGTNPELPQRIAETAGHATEFDTPPAIDRVLQQTVDLLENAEFLRLDAPVEEKPALPVPK